MGKPVPARAAVRRAGPGEGLLALSEGMNQPREGDWANAGF